MELNSEYFMQQALEEAKKAVLIDEVPVGAVIVKDGEIIARAHNMRESSNDPTAHAEILAIREASKKLHNWRLNKCEMYVTLEPCPMCSGAIYQSRLSKIYIGTFDPKCGACGSVIDITNNDYLNSFINIKWLYNKQCEDILKEFFRTKRNNK